MSENFMTILEDLLPQVKSLLMIPESWNSLVINRRKPHTYRMSAMFGNIRVCLHRFEACSQEDVFKHPHPWPGACLILDGEYIHQIGRSDNREDAPRLCYEEIIRPYSMYSITNALTWHGVQPTKTTYTIMVNGPEFHYKHAATVTTKGKDLESMSISEMGDHLDMFDFLIGKYLER